MITTSYHSFEYDRIIEFRNRLRNNKIHYDVRHIDNKIVFYY